MMVFEEHDYKKYPELSNSQLAEMPFDSPHVQIIEDFTATVVKVHDGDTITLRTGFRDFKFPLRMLNIDAPELGEGGEEAGDWLREQILGQKVTILMDKKNRVGKWGRLLGKVLYKGTDMGQTMLTMGLVKLFENRGEGKFRSLDKIFSLKKWF